MVGDVRPLYTAVAERDDAWWAITVAELPGVFSQVRRLDRVESMARDAIAMLLDVDPNSFDVTVREVLSDEAQQVVTAAIHARAEALDRQERASATSREAVRTLTRLGLPQRDIGRLLDLSHQRVGQLVSERPRARGTTRSGARSG